MTANHRTSWIVLFQLLAAGLLAFAGSPHVGVAQEHVHQHVAPGDDFARELAAGMEKMHRDMAAIKPTGNPDVDFLAMMIPHHEGAIEMARLVLVYGRDPLVRQLAEEIIAGQQAEITAMQARLKILRAGTDPSPGGYPSLGGARGGAR